MAHTHPTRLVRFHLLAVLLGVAIAFAVEDLISHGHPTSMLLAEIAFLLSALNFFHGKVVTLEDDDYNTALTDRPLLALVDYALNVMVILCFVFMAFFLNDPLPLIIANLLLRALDSLLVLVVRSALPRQMIRRAQNSWLGINLGAIAIFLAFAWLNWPVDEHPLATSIVFLTIAMGDMVTDYSINRDLYFSRADNWNEMAKFWDAMQGVHGDIYRTAIVSPALLEATGDLTGKRVLDAGCGNGCISRVLAERGANIVGVDKSEKHLAIAKSYQVAGITYLQFDLDESKNALPQAPFDIAIACFTLQDCKRLEGPLVAIARNLKPGGRLIVVFENDYSFEQIEEHSSTTRRWLGSPRHSGNGRRQLISWEPRSIRAAALGAEAEELAREFTEGFKSVTRHWSVKSYKDAATEAGFLFVSHEDNLPVRTPAKPGEHERLALARYRRRARFGMLVFELPT